LKLEEAHSRAKTLFSASEIKPQKFAGIRGYSDEVIRADTAEVQRLEKKFQQPTSEEEVALSRAKEYGDILEAIAFEHGELSDWFGSNARVIKTSRYDDYINKIDLVVETEAPDHEFSDLALGMDVTFGSFDLHKKFDAIRANIDQGKLGRVKYFLSERPGKIFAGPLDNVPYVVVGVEIERVKELGILWMNKKNRQLGEHPVQRILLQEAALQLKTFADYATRVNQPELAAILNSELTQISALMREKREAGIETITHDNVFDEIKRNLESFNSPN